MHLFSGKKESTDKKQNQSLNRNLIEQIILEKYNQYYRLAYSYVHNEADACDIVQSGALKALRSSHSLQNPAYAQTWLYRIMLNECFQCLRRPKLLSSESLRDENEAVLGSVEDSYGDIDLQRALDALQDKEKAVVILKFFEDRTLEEIAEILEENVSTVKSRLYRSIKKLHQILAADEPDDMFRLHGKFYHDKVGN